MCWKCVSAICPLGGGTPDYEPDFPNSPGGNDGGGSDGGGQTNPDIPWYLQNPEIDIFSYSPVVQSVFQSLTDYGIVLHVSQVNYLQENNTIAQRFKTYLATNNSLIKSQNANMGINFFMDNPTATWQDFLNQVPKTPCENTKALMANTNMQASITQLKTNATSGSGEMGFKATKSGTPSPMIPGSAHSVNFGDKTGYAGGYHNHTKMGIPMYSPADINQLLGFARAQGNNGDPTLAFVGMVAPNGMHYIIRFEGTYQDSVNFNFMREDIDNYTDNMAMSNSIFKSSSSTQGIEKLLFKTLNNMGLDGKIILQRVENDGTIKTINKNNDGTITAVPCS